MIVPLLAFASGGSVIGLSVKTKLFGYKPYTRVCDARMQRECRRLCGMKSDKEQKIAEAVSFYKSSPYYRFGSE